MRQTPANKAAQQDALIPDETEPIVANDDDVFVLEDRDGNEYRTSNKAEALNRIRARGYALKK